MSLAEAEPVARWAMRARRDLPTISGCDASGVLDGIYDQAAYERRVVALNLRGCGSALEAAYRPE